MRAEYRVRLDRRDEAPETWQRATGIWRDPGGERAEGLAGRLAALE
ncbi:hypothetical protein AB0E59_44680 [Lentzea sp. NPDC034063]